MKYLLLIILLAGFTDTNAQDTFRSSALGMDLKITLADNVLDEIWSSEPGFTLSWSTPFYLGELDLRAGYYPFKSNQVEVPDINNILTTLSWHFPLQITRRFSVAGGIMIGNSFMYRPVKGILEGPESEFTAGLEASIRYLLPGQIQLHAGIHRNRIYTFHRLDMTYLSLGARYLFPTPSGLANFLQ